MEFRLRSALTGSWRYRPLVPARDCSPLSPDRARDSRLIGLACHATHGRGIASLPSLFTTARSTADRLEAEVVFAALCIPGVERHLAAGVAVGAGPAGDRQLGVAAVVMERPF